MKGADEGSGPGSSEGGQPPRPKISLDISKTLALPREQTEQQQRFEKLKRSDLPLSCPTRLPFNVLRGSARSGKCSSSSAAL